MIRKANQGLPTPTKIKMKEVEYGGQKPKKRQVSENNVTIEFSSCPPGAPISIERSKSGLENIDDNSQQSDTNIKDMVEHQVNQVKMASELISMSEREK